LHDRMREAEDKAARTVAHAALGLTLFARGEIDAALEELEAAVRADQTADEAITVAYRYGMDVGAAALAYRAWCHATLGQADAAHEAGRLDHARAGIAAYRQTGARVQVPFLLTLVAEVAIGLQKPSIAGEALGEALLLIEQTGERQVAPRLEVLRLKLEM